MILKDLLLPKFAIFSRHYPPPPVITGQIKEHPNIYIYICLLYTYTYVKSNTNSVFFPLVGQLR